jgi:hypothetical protein
MAKYGRKAAQKVKKAMHERKHGTLKSGKSGKPVKSRKQAIAIGLSEARRAGAKVPPAPESSRTKKSTNAKKRTTKSRTTKRRSKAKKAVGTKSSSASE